MSSNDKHRKLLLNRMSITQEMIQNIEVVMGSDEETAKHLFHKIIIHKWTDSDTDLFEMLYEYYSVIFIPVNFTSQNLVTTFYTSSLSLVLKIIKLDFMFPYARNMFNVDILYNDKTSEECFNAKLSIEDIINSLVSNRFNENCMLDLSNFCKDPELVDKKIWFYKLSLLSHFKILMLRMGRDTKVLNLSNNNLSKVPLEILNFFIKGDLIGVNLSENNIPSVLELQRVSSRVEKLWIEGNPLCDETSPVAYIKQVVKKFPRLTELDGVKLNEHGFMLPFHRHFIVDQDKKAKMVVEKFVSLYFAYFDSIRKKIDSFYDDNCILTLSANLTEKEEFETPFFVIHLRNAAKSTEKSLCSNNRRMYSQKADVVNFMCQFPATLHDPGTFHVDVLVQTVKYMVLVIDGLFKVLADDKRPDRFFHFRRTFVFSIYVANNMSTYHIAHDVFSVSSASQALVENSFKFPIRHANKLTLIDPTRDEKDVLCKALVHYTQLKRAVAETRLELVSWDLRDALKQFYSDYTKCKINQDDFVDQDTDDISDSSSILDEID